MQRDVLSFAIQIKAARALLGWSQADLAQRSGVARATVARIEALMMLPRLDTVSKLRHAMKEVGVNFIDDEVGNGFSISISGAAVDILLRQAQGIQALAIKNENQG